MVDEKMTQFYSRQISTLLGSTLISRVQLETCCRLARAVPHEMKGTRGRHTGHIVSNVRFIF